LSLISRGSEVLLMDERGPDGVPHGLAHAGQTILGLLPGKSRTGFFIVHVALVLHGTRPFCFDCCGRGCESEAEKLAGTGRGKKRIPAGSGEDIAATRRGLLDRVSALLTDTD